MKLMYQELTGADWNVSSALAATQPRTQTVLHIGEVAFDFR